MNSPNRRQRSSGRSNDEANDEDIEVLRKEYRNMQANRNAFAHESEMVSNNVYNHTHTFTYIQPLLTDLPSFHPYPKYLGAPEAAGNSRQTTSRERDAQDRCGKATNTSYDSTYQFIRTISAG